MRFRQPQKTWHALFLSAVMISFQWLITTSVVSICILAWPVGVGANTVILEDTIQGSTTDTSQGGVFLGDGWHVTGQYESIYGHIPSTPFDAVEWDFCGLNPDESRPEFKTLFIVDRMGIEPGPKSSGNQGGGDQSGADCGALGAREAPLDPPLATWLDACPIRLNDAQRDVIRTLLNGGAG